MKLVPVGSPNRPGKVDGDELSLPCHNSVYVGGVSSPEPGAVVEIRDARSMFPATATSAYFNTAAVGLASRELTIAYHRYVDEWSHSGLDYVRGEAAAEAARTSVAALIGADRSDIALIASVSAAAGLVAAQFGPAGSGHNVVIGEREYSSNHFPWTC